MEIITEQTPEKEPVIDYDFVFLNGRGAQLSVWTGRGDSTRYNREDKQWEFEFPRLEKDEIVLRDNVLTVSRQRTSRVYIDPAQLMEQMREAQRRTKKEREEKDARRG